MITTTTRRAILAGAAALPALAAPCALASSTPDPTFAVIERHRYWRGETDRLYNLLEEAEGAAVDDHGHRPIPLVDFNDHTIGQEGIEDHRERMLAEAVTGADRKMVEREYSRAKTRLAELERGGPEWDERAGITTLRAECTAANEREQAAFLALLKTGKPATTAGIAALLRYLHAWGDGMAAGWLRDWGSFSTAGAGFMLVVADAVEAVAGKAVQS